MLPRFSGQTLKGLQRSDAFSATLCATAMVGSIAVMWTLVRFRAASIMPRRSGVVRARRRLHTYRWPVIGERRIQAALRTNRCGLHTLPGLTWPIASVRDG